MSGYCRFIKPAGIDELPSILCSPLGIYWDVGKWGSGTLSLRSSFDESDKEIRAREKAGTEIALQESNLASYARSN